MLRTFFQIALQLGTNAWDLAKSPEGRLEKYTNNELFEELLTPEKYILLDVVPERVEQLGAKYLRYWIPQPNFDATIKDLIEAAKRAVHVGEAEGFEIAPDYSRYTKGGVFIRVDDLKALALRRMDEGLLPQDGHEVIIASSDKERVINISPIRALGIVLNLGNQMTETQLSAMNGRRFYRNKAAQPT